MLFYGVRIRALAPGLHLLECEARWRDGSRLLGVEVLEEASKSLVRFRYRWQYLDTNDSSIFRYDNAPHHPEVNTFPHHKHTPSGIEPAEPPSPEQIISEVERHIVGRQT